MKKQHKTYFYILCFIIILALYRWYDLSKYKNHIVVFFNTQEGDSIMIRAPDYCTILIDGGSDYAMVDALYKYLPVFKREIDYVFLSHPHQDHIYGLSILANRFEFLNFYYSVQSQDYPILKQMLPKLKNSLLISSDYQTIQACGLQILAYKAPNFESDINTQSLILEIYKDSKFIFFAAGDLYQSQERLVLQTQKLQEVYLFKSNHHGSNTSNSIDLLQALKPKISVVTSGYANRFQHPNFQALKNIKNHSTKVLRTDVEGEILIQIPD